MSRYITTTVIFILLIITIVFSDLYITNACEKIFELTDETKHFLELSEFEKAENALSEAAEYISNKKDGLMMIIEHTQTETLEIKLHKAESYTRSREKSLALAELSEARDLINNIKSSQKMTYGNIL